MQLVPLDRATNPATCGGKAANLAAAMAAGLPVPPGFVVPVEAFAEARAAVAREGVPAGALETIAGRLLERPLAAEVLEAIAAACARLRPPFIARSSATAEDAAGAALPGMLESTGSLASAASVAAAIRSIWASLFRVEVDAYLRHHGRNLAEVGVAVLVQEEVAGARGILYTRPPWEEDGGVGGPIFQASEGEGSVLVQLDSPPAPGEPLDRRQRRALRSIVAPAERVAGGAADVEWVAAGDAVVVVQVRPLPPSTLHRFEVDELDPAERELIWRWDAEHNPEPLSAAQAGLVALVERRCRTPFRQRVFGGYLFSAEEPGAALVHDHELRLPSGLLDALDRVERAETLADALEGYVAFYQRYAGELSPVLSAARRALSLLLDPLLALRGRNDAADLLGRLLGGIQTVTVRLDQALFEIGCAALAGRPFQDLLDRLLLESGALSPSWDVAVATFGEEPAPLLRAAERLCARGAAAAPEVRRLRAAEEGENIRKEVATWFTPQDRAIFDAALRSARHAVALGEADDVLFARAQRAVRRLLLRRGSAWQAQGILQDSQQIFDLPIEEVAAAEGTSPPPDAARRAAGERERRRRARALLPPERIEGGRAVYLRALWTRPAATLTGTGFGGRVRGRATHGIGSREADSVLILPTVLPAHSILLAGAIALVTDHGGLLDHGAALAREYGLVTVVGTRFATRRIQEGVEVVVDGASGRVYVLSD